MLKNCILFLFIWVSAFSQAQENYYNKTIDIDNVHNGFSGINHFNSDTVLIDGFLQDQPYKRYRTFSYINAINGDTITSFKYGRDTIDIYGGNTIDMCIVGNEIFACGAYYKNGKTFANILKFSMGGQLLLDSLYFNEYEWAEFDCLLYTNDDNFMLVGSKEVSSGNLDAWLVKVDYFGNIIWEQTFGGFGVDAAFQIVPFDQNSFLIAAYYDLYGGNKSKIWIKKIDLFGNTVWNKYFDGEDYDGAYVKVLQDSNIIIYGALSTIENVNALPFVMKLNSFGEEIWRYFPSENLYLSSQQNTFICLVENTNHSLTLIGAKWDDSSAHTIGFFQKLSMDGDSLWYRELSIRNNQNYLTDLKLLNNGDLLMTGYVFPDSPNNTEDGWIMRTNCLGYFEHPKDSIVLSGSGENVLSLTNYSSYYDYTIVDWGDNSSDTVYASGNQNIMHEYTLPGNYSINTTTIACNDTIHKNSEYLVIPEQFESSDLVIFPNPNQGHFEIWLDSPDLYSLEIMDLNGRIVKSALNVKMNQGYIIDLSELGSSIYFVRAFSGDKIFQKRVVTIDY